MSIWCQLAPPSWVAYSAPPYAQPSRRLPNRTSCTVFFAFPTVAAVTPSGAAGAITPAHVLPASVDRISAVLPPASPSRYRIWPTTVTEYGRKPAGTGWVGTCGTPVATWGAAGEVGPAGVVGVSSLACFVPCPHPASANALSRAAVPARVAFRT